jgi:hypothetical protein
VVTLAERTSIQIYKETKKELTKVIGELQAQDGNKRSYDEAIRELIKSWNNVRTR